MTIRSLMLWGIQITQRWVHGKAREEITASICRERSDEPAISEAISHTLSEEDEATSCPAGAGGVERVHLQKPAPSSTNQYGPAHEGLVLPPSVAIPQCSFWSVNSWIFLSRMKIPTWKYFLFPSPSFREEHVFFYSVSLSFTSASFPSPKHNVNQMQMLSTENFSVDN